MSSTNTIAPQSFAAHAAVELFEVPFGSPMDDVDLYKLARALELSTGLGSKGSPPQDRVGPARLDHDSGLFLVPGQTEGQWLLQARTWGHPGPEAVHRWNVLAASAAHELDPTVTAPERRNDDSPDIPNRPVGSASNKRFSGFRRRLGGLS